MRRREFIAECLKEDTLLFILIFFLPSGITICLLLFPCTQLPVPLGHARERVGEDREEENQGGRYKKRQLDKQT